MRRQERKSRKNISHLIRFSVFFSVHMLAWASSCFFFVCSTRFTKIQQTSVVFFARKSHSLRSNKKSVKETLRVYDRKTRTHSTCQLSQVGLNFWLLDQQNQHHQRTWNILKYKSWTFLFISSLFPWDLHASSCSMTMTKFIQCHRDEREINCKIKSLRSSLFYILANLI